MKSLNILYLVTFSVFIYLVSPILTPFVLSIFFAWLLNPVVRHLVDRGCPRILAVSLVFLLLLLVIIAVILLVVPRIGSEIASLLHLLPNAVSYIQSQIPSNFSDEIITNLTTLKGSLAESTLKAGGLIGVIFKTILQSGTALAAWLGEVILVPVVTIYLLYDWQLILKHTKGLLPSKSKKTILKLASKCDVVLAAFFRGQILVMLTLGVIYAVGLSLLGLQLGVLIGVVAGLFAIVPYLGAIFGVITACIAAWTQFGVWTAVLPVLILFVVVQSLDSVFITPKLVGHRIGLHPVLVIFAVLAGGAISGFTGALVALPIAAMARVTFDFLINKRG